MPVIGKVLWAFLLSFLLMIGLSVLLVVLNVDFINWDLGPRAATVHIGIGCAIGAFIGGLIAHSLKKGIISMMPIIIIVLGALGIVTILEIISIESRSMGFEFEFRVIRNFYPQVAEYYGQLTYSASASFFYWWLPGIVFVASIIPASMIGGYLSGRFIKVKPPKKGVFVTKEKRRMKDVFAIPLFLLIFVLSWAPLFAGLFNIQTNVNKDFSAWNYTNSGTSDFRQALESAGYTNIHSCITSYSVLTRYDEPTVLVVLGPGKFYNPISDIPFMLKFLKNNGSILVADDHGSTDYLMRYLFYMSLGLYFNTSEMDSPVPLMFFPNGVLKDNASYYKQNQIPVITSDRIFPHEVTRNVSKLVLDSASGLLLLIPGLAEAFGWEVLAQTTDEYSWIDVDDNGVNEDDIDRWEMPFELRVLMQQFGIEIEGGIDLGGVPIPVIAATEFGNGSRIVCTADASIFTNELFELPGHDNKQFALNCIDWLTNGNKSVRIIFDEAHLSIKGAQDVSPPAIYGQF
ncbi:MAG: hypothetical protein ACTSRA_12450, partial [Promethearchaeota archaeon]